MQLAPTWMLGGLTKVVWASSRGYMEIQSGVAKPPENPSAAWLVVAAW